MSVTDQASLPRVVRTNRLGYLRVATIEADPGAPHTVPPRFADRSAPYLGVGVQDLGTSRVVQNGHGSLVRPGELFVVDADRTFTLEHESHVRVHAFRLPRRAVAIADRDVHAVTARAIVPGSGVSAVVKAVLTSLACSPDPFAPAVGERLAGNVTDLLASLITELAPSAAPAPPSVSSELTLRIRKYIDANLGDPDLSPERVARSQRISPRYLHRVFESEDITVGRLIQRRRLEECARELARRGRSSPTVAAVAQRWGFVSPAHFSRAFRAMYGVSPTEWRDRGQGPHPAVPGPGKS
ncbi:hypothetical protein B4N89_42335 [Embleya scabrispora]|uniref:HTH araC/xylS-type domain-containing protein n=1 Tax=Embleya scabrispora TaxID=159449 RepID=A0A1T3NK13_9ACTN|nr:helix-turn-helix domain-containing protein [Embleya scabrispora]OPC77189.1 hypothetical protein B4N89_42335 [Embleya scabrispora]